MGVVLKKTTDQEVIQLHDIYAFSPEPDAPERQFADLTDEEKQKALNAFRPKNHLTVWYNNEIVGFVGCYPDEKFIDINIFAVIVPIHRGKKYFSLALQALIEYCRSQHSKHKQIRSLTRKSNIPAIRGLKSLSFNYAGVHTEEYDDKPENDVEYEEYTLSVKI